MLESLMTFKLKRLKIGQPVISCVYTEFNECHWVLKIILDERKLHVGIGCDIISLSFIITS
jgi:hypothetical protein